MKVVVIGYGIQGKKRKEIAGTDCVAVVDTIDPTVPYTDICHVPLDLYDAALVCTPDHCKVEILTYLLSHRKHVLVEKPLMGAGLEHLLDLATRQQVTCYTAYNHRFEPHFVRMKEIIDSGLLGTIYHCRMFYGNGTARDVALSPWRDQGLGVCKDLGSHLLDTALFWFGPQLAPFKMIQCNRFENKSPDHAILNNGMLELEMSLLSWRNHFTCDLFAQHGSAHIESLCKWGPTTLTLRKRQLPSGRPPEESTTFVQPDPTWKAEYEHFKKLCSHGVSNLSNDLSIQSILENL